MLNHSKYDVLLRSYVTYCDRPITLSVLWCQKWFTINFVRKDLPSDEKQNIIFTSALCTAISNTSSCTLIIINIYILTWTTNMERIDHSLKNVRQVMFPLWAHFKEFIKIYTVCQWYNHSIKISMDSKSILKVQPLFQPPAKH